MEAHQPRIFQDLRLALSVLYSLPPPSPASRQSVRPSSEQAHEFLLQFQCRNVRRKISSAAKSKNQVENNHDAQPPLDAADFGSSWLACLALLSSLVSSNQNHPQASYAEALFAAQTLVHRLRRVTLAEAVDLEFEPPLTPFPPQPQYLINSYKTWMHKLDANVGEILKQYTPHSHNEDCIKGEMSMLLLTTIMHCLTLKHYHELGSIRPLLTTLASALASIAARLRFTSIAYPDPAPNTQPIVTMIIQSLSMVHQIISATTTHPPDFQSLAYAYSLYTCMTAVPDAILAGCGSGGGSHGRMSMDPRCFTAVTTEVRTQGISQVWQSFADLPSPQDDHLVLFLVMCEEWAKYAPLPKEFVQRSISLVEIAFVGVSGEQPNNRQCAAGKAAMGYWIAIMEGGSWNVEQVLSASLLQKQENTQQPSKKRQSTKSKKRQKEVLEERTTANQLVLAQNEVQHRGDVACETAMLTWHHFRSVLSKELEGLTDADDEVQGDGPVGGITACSNACLPHLLRQPSQSKESLDLFVSVASAIQDICSSPARMVRAFAAESLYKLNEIVLKLMMGEKSLGDELESIIVNHFFKCSMCLAASCCYPPGYFHDLAANNDEDLENERNDVRDVLRCISSSPELNGKPRSQSAMNLTSRILLQLLQACAQPLQEIKEDPCMLFPETALHAFSALAKPLNSTAKVFARSPSDDLGLILTLATDILSNAGQRLIRAFPVAPVNDILPLSRLFNLAVSSLSPMLSTLAPIQAFERSVLHATDTLIQAASLSLLRIPELTSESTLRSTRYDIRGAMRSPGGEDHVGVLALMRLASESEVLARVFVSTKKSIVIDLCKLFEQLKAMEHERGRGVLHGRGVLPKSRRILLGVICRLEIATAGAAGASGVLKDIFVSAVTSIASLNAQINQPTADMLFQICEHVFDLAAFSPTMIGTLFNFKIDDAMSPEAICMNVLHSSGVFGYKSLSESAATDQSTLFQWNRVRASLFSLLKVSGTPDLPPTAVEILVGLIRAECDAIMFQCNVGPRSSSHIFREELISEEGVPAGIFIRVLGEILDKPCSAGLSLDSMSNCVRVLFDSRVAVLHAFASHCPNPVETDSFCDPRLTLAEAWYFCINKLLIAAQSQGGFNDAVEKSELWHALRQLFIDTFVSTVGLLLYPSLGKTQDKRLNDPGMSFDGPHTLAIMDFFQAYFSLGPSMLQAAAMELLKVIPIDHAALQVFSNEADAAGIAIMGAALFRAAQGGLPPWAVECIPPVYAALYHALDKNPNSFGLVFEMSMRVKLMENHHFGGVQAGHLLSGRFFATMGDKAKHTFVTQAVELAKTDSTSGWKRLKASIKQACGGKKKDTDFKQRPASTKWDALDRV